MDSYFHVIVYICNVGNYLNSLIIEFVKRIEIIFLNYDSINKLLKLLGYDNIHENKIVINKKAIKINLDEVSKYAYLTCLNIKIKKISNL